MSTEYFDNLGTSQVLEITYTPTVPATGSSNEWTMTMRDSASGNAVVGEYTVTFDDSPGNGGNLLSVATVSGGAYNATTGSIALTVDGGPLEVEIGAIGDPSGLTQLSDTFSFAPVVKESAQHFLERADLGRLAIDQHVHVEREAHLKVREIGRAHV